MIRINDTEAYVQEDDSVASIAFEAGISIDTLCKLNGVERNRSDKWLVRKFKNGDPIIVSSLEAQEARDKHIFDVMTDIDMGE